MYIRFATHGFAKFFSTPSPRFVPFDHRHMFFPDGHRIFLQNYHTKRKKTVPETPLPPRFAYIKRRVRFTTHP